MELLRCHVRELVDLLREGDLAIGKPLVMVFHLTVVGLKDVKTIVMLILCRI